ncbi:GNAT family N-acetyltransferase [Psychrobacter cryohalolentis]|uniref:GCN5-related N-acetyltransferase n=1 Tax=Psychrobacter cryohalolentis (strain ATCC BAA-1226 / DSM 17306 / VKM B-2378 / K5) TaxID=335284 RepID=Q1QEE3_PSYCK|nr:GNAT family N-acetyltransferase [Psychrobacter cryohalolentis]ABE73960.1 GCN5-related N-acetyltransferase [Psychrobacter cryohalolentis K5]ASE26596.1 N-acetyltransferase [Psychrobacter cryohalolentis]
MFCICKAHSKDFADIAHIHCKSWHDAYLGLLPKSYINNQNNLSEKTKMWQEVITHPDVIIWIAYDANHKSLGFIGYFTKNNSYEITTLYVLSEYHGLGIGSKLMKRSLQAILSFNINANFYLWVLEDNASAIHFYKKFGFVYDGEKSEEHYKDIQIVDIKMIKKNEDLPYSRL